MPSFWSTPLPSSWIPAVSPIFDTDRVYVLLADALVAYRLADGTESWRVPWPSGYASGWVFADLGGVLVAALYKGRSEAVELVAHDRDGACLWRHTVHEFTDRRCAAVGSRFWFTRVLRGEQRLDFIDRDSGQLERAPMPELGNLADVGGELWLMADERTHRFDATLAWRPGIEVPKVWRAEPHADRWLVLRQIEGNLYRVGLHDGTRFLWEHETTYHGFVVIDDQLVRSLPDAIEACAIETGEPSWRVAAPAHRRLAVWGERILVGLVDKTLVLDARDGACAAVLPTAIDRAAFTPSLLVVADRGALSAWPFEIDARAPIDVANLDATLDAILARDAAADVVPSIVALGLDLLDLHARERAIRRALSSDSPHGPRVAEEALGDLTSLQLLRAAIETCPSNRGWLQKDLAKAARNADPAALWPALLARTARYAWEARERIVDAPEAVLRDPAGFAALVQGAATQRLLSAFLERAERALDEGALSAEIVRDAAGAIETALATYPSESEIAGRLTAFAAKAGLASSAMPRSHRQIRLVPETYAAEAVRWERELTGAYHYALFESIGHPAPSYYLPFPPAIELKGLTVVLPDPSPVTHGSWLVALELFAEGMLAVDEALSDASTPRPAPNPDPFGRRARRGRETPASQRFEAAAKTLGPVLAESWPAGWSRVDEVVADICAPGPLADRTQIRAAAWSALALGIAFHHATYRVRVAPFERLVDALEAGGAYRAPKRPSLAALKKAHPAIPYWPLHALEEPPATAIESCVARGTGAPCPALDPEEVPVDGAGRPLDFVCQLVLDGLRGLPEGFAQGAALVAVFTGARGAVVALDAAAVTARAGRAVPPGVVALERGRKSKEPPSAAWILRVDPDRFAGQQSPHDVETLLGAWSEATREAHYTTSKIGGTYTPVQPFTTCLPEAGAHHLVAQLDFDDGAPLPDAGLLYVIAMADGGWFVGAEHT